MKRFDTLANYRSLMTCLPLLIVFTVLAFDAVTYYLAGFAAGLLFMWGSFTWYISLIRKKETEAGAPQKET